MTNCNSSTSSPIIAPTGLEAPQQREGYVSGQARRIELILGPTGCFRPLVEEYLAKVAPKYYQPKDVNTVRMSIGAFMGFVADGLDIQFLDEIRPSTITQYIDQRRALGYKSSTFLGHLASFFSWLAYEGLYDRGNPVIHRFHRERMSAPTTSHGA